MAILSRSPGRPRIRTSRSTTSIREVCLFATQASRPELGPGDSVLRAGRSYRVVAIDGGEYLHVCPAECESR